LREKLEAHFSKDEVRTLASDLDVEYENLPRPKRA